MTFNTFAPTADHSMTDVIHTYEAAAQARQRQSTEAFKQAYARRAGIEEPFHKESGWATCTAVALSVFQRLDSFIF